MINTIIFLNGIYDLVCGFLFLDIHKLVFKIEYNNDLMKRLLSYWIITYGIIRIAIISNNPIINIMIIISYFIEIFAFFNESYFYNTTDKNKVEWIIILSLIIIIIKVVHF